MDTYAKFLTALIVLVIAAMFVETIWPQYSIMFVLVTLAGVSLAYSDFGPKLQDLISGLR